MTAEAGTTMRLAEHHSTSAHPGERGERLGLAHRDEIRSTVALYRAFYRELGIPVEQETSIAAACHAALAGWYPVLAEEIGAVAAAAGLEPAALMAVTARTEILAIANPQREGECSTAVLLPPDRGGATAAPETIQTWDWHESLVPAALLWEYPSVQGLRVKTFTEFGAPAKIGVNDAGLGVHFNILHHRADHGRGGVPVHAVARRILDEARTVGEAVAIARSAEVSASTVITVVTSEPGAVSIEICPAGVAEVHAGQPGGVPAAADAGSGAAVLLHTNHFLDPGLAAGEHTPDASTTYARLEHLRARAGELAGQDAVRRAQAMCGPAGDAAPICFQPDRALPPQEQWTTLLTVSLDLGGYGLEYAAGSPAVMARGAERF
ncbi:C45 family autoproteolytic acyltransferase/hydolase [Sediminivirga luteola]|uniref:Peptidase C45 hydrolase domain-containing protein n=1 Tax=Sediminivirga luteola TaxID=1774748 RepID=A0A8J2TY04_9MICO|nr:C45 family peptidase [Sediminivirga luteola]MCI2265823.1 C45 family peptidase [Sediminivirga luteola]GGA14362.1 hypothetical protein GCM10011333_16580 [Sediminivirga luteola]